MVEVSLASHLEIEASDGAAGASRAARVGRAVRRNLGSAPTLQWQQDWAKTMLYGLIPVQLAFLLVCAIDGAAEAKNRFLQKI